MLHLSNSATYYISLTEVQGNFLYLKIEELGTFYSILTLVGYYKIVSGLKAVRQLTLQRKILKKGKVLENVHLCKCICNISSLFSPALFTERDIIYIKILISTYSLAEGCICQSKSCMNTKIPHGP